MRRRGGIESCSRVMARLGCQARHGGTIRTSIVVINISIVMHSTQSLQLGEKRVVVNVEGDATGC